MKEKNTNHGKTQGFASLPTILIALITLAIGLGLGYLLFGGQDGAGRDGKSSVSTAATDTPSETTYTCSMHPQIRQPEPGICPICEMDLIPVSKDGKSSVSSDPLVFTMTREAARLANIQTTKLDATGSERIEVPVSGRLARDERRLASQTTHIPGRIEALYVTFTGEQVQAGDRLATIYSPELITAQQELLQAISFQGPESDLAQAARHKLEYWKLPAEWIDEVIAAGEVRETIDIVADQAGVVADRKVAVGDYVQRGGVLYTLVDLSRLWVLLDVYEDDLAQVNVGDRVRFTTPAVPGQVFTARLSFIDPLIDPQTRTATARAEIRNSSNRLKPDMLVRGTIIGDQLAGGEQLIVPASAVLWTGKRSVVYTREAGTTVPSFRFREIILGERIGNGYLVEEGLNPGEEVVTNGAFVIDAAAQLNNQASMMNREVVLEGQEARDEAPDFREVTDGAFQEGMNRLVARYIELKDAFVATDAPRASVQATAMQEQLAQIPADLLTGEAYDFWQQQKGALQSHLQSISGASEVGQQRQQFEFVSNLMIDLVRAFGSQEKPVYVQHCPMAFNDRGADWLAYEDQILNPYFGEQMLRCGVVEDSIK